ncbi:DUF551 domain-containing protein [Escherichia coli]|uniref:DUF551 domain-containing protein n=1 Tax=Enterobacteriaceae TaxID=543 RepID=UPI000224557C|nr:DUF551 domain-containing protein [Escherichia coli]EAA6585945.1 DUF551 domain-containing protein [Salmonella enterica subsp. enterica serovar Typhimurium]EAW8510768.1 DUF551 domain-containing protein [Salmonella enterica]EDL9773657.1 hypothetical protein [Salmonella enterica subsp. enterica serovar Heidelberg]EBF2003039.1 DUF551 domain-containing protein [Salmonella enterica]EES9570908.1 DUF551 domain-containing protein [Escherichia coli]
MTTITREQALKIIEAADEVISALAGTNEDVHPGSDNMLRLWDDLNDRYAPPEIVRELARIVLASLEAEPVLYQSCTRPTWNSGVPWTEWKERSRECYEDDLRFTDTPDHAGWIYKCRKLYTTPPAPIALEAIENAIEYIRSIAFHIDEDDYHGKHIAYFMQQALAWLEGHSCSDDRLGKAENQPVRGNQAAESNRDNEWTGNPDIDNAIIMLDRIDTLENCDDDRIEAVKAVLRRLAGNYPVIPDGWISCSERMPENIPGSCKEYLVFDGLNNKVHHDYWVVPDGDSAPVASFWNHYGAHVTHWMPLPEPPQEAK